MSLSIGDFCFNSSDMVFEDCLFLQNIDHQGEDIIFIRYLEKEKWGIIFLKSFISRCL